MRPNYQNLCQKLGYQFNKIALLETALTHRSIRGQHNERLEFLGDSIVNFIMAEALFDAVPKANEGELSRLRARLICGDALAKLAQDFELGSYLRLGAGELKSGGFRRQSILADAMEAVIAAIYLDAGMPLCKERVLVWYAAMLAEILHSADQEHKDPKSQLQEYLQAKKLELPQYVVTKITGEAHQQTFYVSCQVPASDLVTEGVGSSRRVAEQAAAQAYLLIIRGKKKA